MDIYRYSFGNPLHTGSVENNKQVPLKKEAMDYFEVLYGSSITLKYQMNRDTAVYGLGENQRGINKRGGLYHSYCSDDAMHTPDKRSMYGAHNFLLIDGQEPFGIFVDFPGRVIFDVGFSVSNMLEISICGCDADIYIIKGEGLRNIARTFLRLIGGAYVPPKWAFGYQQSRWSYADAEEVNALAESFIMHDIPCDAIYLDIDYMESFKDFTVDSSRFPDFKSFVKKMKEKGFRLVPIIDAGVKIEKGYDVYDEGIQKGFFCRDGSGAPFVAAVWPGKVHFPDFMKPEARKWFGLKYRMLTDCGIEGFWNDMNEPAIFYTERGLNKAVEKAKAAEGKNLDVYEFFRLKEAFHEISNSPEDYGSFYHDFEGMVLPHDRVHNLYGYYMTMAAAEGLQEIAPDKRFLLFSRASCVGMHKYAGLWTGDNHSWWEHLLLNIKMMPSLNMCGFLYCGADTGGFGGDADAELLIRWMQFSVFTPLFRNHSALGTRQQEPFAFDEETTGILRNVIRLRYALVPYLYSEYMKAARDKDVYFAPLSFDYGDKASKGVEDQLLLGASLMLCPVYTQNARGRYVWAPEDMLLWKVSDYVNRKYEVVKKGHHYIEVGLEEMPVFIRKDRMLVMGRHGRNIDSLDKSRLQVLAFVGERAEYVLYDDDGSTKAFIEGIYSEVHIVINKSEKGFDVKAVVKGETGIERLDFEIVDVNGRITAAVLLREDFIICKHWDCMTQK